MDRPPFRRDIEGLRGIAILLVIAFHAGVSWLAGGFVGVDVFFVLSGYLITGLLVREISATGDLDLPAFYARRARRLLPAFLVVLLATIGIALWLYAPIDAPRVASDGRAVALHYSNVLFAAQAVNYHRASGSPFLHTWSLAVEEQFYIIWPLLFAFVARMRVDDATTRRRMMVAVAVAGAASLAASIIMTRASQPWAFFGMPTRIWEFAAGALLSLRNAEANPSRLLSSSSLQLGGLAAIAVAAIAYDGTLPYPGFAALLPVLGTVAILRGGEIATDGRGSAALGHPVLQWFGRISYSWYLWHWPLVALGTVIDHRIGVVGKLAWSGIALGLAVLTQHYLEERFRRNDTLGGAPHRLNLYALAASGVAALLAWAALSVAATRSSSSVQQRFAQARVDGMQHDCWGSLTENATAPCVFGDRSATTRVVLMGDSHAEHWLPAMDRIGRERHWKVYSMVKPACPVADLPDMVNASLRRPYSECTAWRAEKLRAILALRPSFVVLSSYDHYVASDGRSSWNVTPKTWYQGLRRTYSMLSNANIPVIAMRDVPDVGFDVPSCLSRRASDAPFQRHDCRFDLTDGLVPEAIAAQSAAARGLRNVWLLDMNDRVCPARTSCPTVVRGAVAYRDDDHLTATFSRAEAPALGDRISSLLSQRR